MKQTPFIAYTQKYTEFKTLFDWMHDRKMVLNSVEVLLVVKVMEDDWKMEKKQGRSSFKNKGRPYRHIWLPYEDFR